MLVLTKQPGKMRVSKTTVLAGAGLYVGVATAAYLRFKGDTTHPHSQACQHQSGAAFDEMADTYDNQIGWDEKLMGVTLIRWWLIRQAKVSQQKICCYLCKHALTVVPTAAA